MKSSQQNINRLDYAIRRMADRIVFRVGLFWVFCLSIGFGYLAFLITSQNG